MLDRIANLIFKIRRLSFFRIFQRTLVMLMPIAIIGSYFKLMQSAVFSPNSFIYNLFNFDETMPDHVWYAGAFISNGFVRVTFGLFGLYTAYFAARYTARLYHKDSTMAGMTSVMVIMFCAYANNVGNSTGDHSPFSSSFLKINAFFIALVIGYSVGQIFHWLGKDHIYVEKESANHLKIRAWGSLLPAIVSVLGGMLLGVAIYELQIKVLNSGSFKTLVAQIEGSNNLGEIVLLSMLVMALGWLGIGYPLSALSDTANSAAATTNLNFALKHGSSWNVPYKFLGSSLVNPYGVMGGASIVMALIVIVLVMRKNRENENIARASLLPVAFNSNWGFMIGLPIILNPVLFIPVIVIPVVNILLAGGAISLHLIQPCVYPVLKGTPGILISFFGSNGNLVNLAFSIFLFVLDIAMLIPVAMLEIKIEGRLQDYEKGK